MSPPTISDAQLIARVVVQDDRHAFSELVRRHQSAVRATLRRLAAGNAALADDLAQETFLLAYRNLKSFRQDAKFSTWLYRIAYNVFLGDARKTRELELPEDANLETAQWGDAEPPPTIERQVSLKSDLDRAMSVLGLPKGLAITAKVTDNDLSHEEAASVLGWPVGTVKTNILRAKQKLKARMAAWAPDA